jgi:cytochrome c-type biogenesis protein CcsB
MTQSTPLSLALFGIAVGIYSLSVAVFVVALAFRRAPIAKTGVALVMLGWPFHAASIFTRGLEGGHWPLGNMYEYSTGISFVLVTTFLVIALRSKQRLIGLPVMVMAVALLGVAYMVYVPPGELVPALHSYWLTIHVTAMATSSGLLTFSFLFGMGYLARRWADGRVERKTKPPRGGLLQVARSVGAMAATEMRAPRFASALQAILPERKTLDAWSYRFVMLGFPVWSFGVICGAIWGEHAWGRYWGWDPKETFAFITWVIFAIYLHARVTYGWKEKRAAMITAVGMVSILFTLYAVNLWIAGLHSYAKA